MSTARKLLAEALTLDEHERASLALELMDSLAPPDARDEDAWLDAIEQRARRALSGEEPGVEVDAAIDRMAIPGTPEVPEMELKARGQRTCAFGG